MHYELRLRKDNGLSGVQDPVIAHAELRRSSPKTPFAQSNRFCYTCPQCNGMQPHLSGYNIAVQPAKDLVGPMRSW